MEFHNTIFHSGGNVLAWDLSFFQLEDQWNDPTTLETISIKSFCICGMNVLDCSSY